MSTSLPYFTVPTVSHVDMKRSGGKMSNSVIGDLQDVRNDEKATDIEDRMKSNLDHYFSEDVFLEDSIPEQAKIMASRIQLRSDEMYQFVMLVCGFAKMPIDSVLQVPSFEVPTAQKKRGQGDDIFDTDDAPLSTSASFLQRPQLSEHILLPPSMYAHMEEAYNMVTERSEAIKDVSIEAFMTDSLVRTYFARMVAYRMKLSAVFSGDTYFLEKTQPRILKEQAMLFHFFKKLRYNGTKFYRDSNYFQNRYFC